MDIKHFFNLSKPASLSILFLRFRYSSMTNIELYLKRQFEPSGAGRSAQADPLDDSFPLREHCTLTNGSSFSLPILKCR